jgi:hypothetical protein
MRTDTITIHPDAKKLLSEHSFEIFRHDGLLCCVQRMGWSGTLNGYVAVDEKHPFYGKEYGDLVVVGDIDSVEFNGNYIGLLCATLRPETDAGMLSIDLAIKVHGGITYSKDELCGIENGLFGNLWWFGFDTIHSGDLKPFQTDIDRKYPISGDEYRNFEYVISETKKLAEQLSQYHHKTTQPK